MSKMDFFPQKPKLTPIVYAYSDSRYPNMLKVGYTTRSIEERMREHYPTIVPNQSYKVEWTAPCTRPDGSVFMDYDLHHYLQKHHVLKVAGEWYKCNIDNVKSAYLAVMRREDNEENRTQDFRMRPEQERVVNRTAEYFKSIEKDRLGSPKFLWNCKMRFGKTFASYELAKKMGFKRILILTFKPAVQSAWEEDLNSHIDFEGWQFVSRNGKTFESCDKSKPIVCFGSFQDYLGTNDAGGIKAKNEWVHTNNWDIVIFDEYHFGAWRDTAKNLFAKDDDEQEEIFDEKKKDDLLDETWLPITSNYYLYLSGTPFRAINSGEFIEEQIESWTYSDEQNAKETWDYSKGKNLYEALPRLVLMTYEIPKAIRQIAINTDVNEFDLNEFFKAEKVNNQWQFIHINEVQKWLDLMRGEYDISSDLRVGTGRGQSFLPFKETALLNVLNHTLWFLPNISSCEAMYNLLCQTQNRFYRDYKINRCYGTQAGVGLDALQPVLNSMAEPLESKTITLSCGKLTTGVTVKPWSGIFMLRNLSTPETYIQSAFRVQSPWTIKKEDGSEEVVKKECYVFDFALDRALKQIADYAMNLDINESNPEKKVADFINFLPVLAYQDGTMRQIDAGQILDIAMSGTTASLLARRWESALLVNVDNATLARLLASEEAMAILSKIEGFRSLNKDISTIISKSEDVKKKRKENPNPTPKQKNQMDEEEKEYKSKRKQIQDKLIKFATRIPVFMYLTDFREFSLKDVITKLEPTLFKKVTGLEVKDFELLVSLGIFNDALMNDAVYKFKRYEDSSLDYAGINKHAGEKVGGYSTVLSDEEYKMLYGQQQLSLAGFKKVNKKIEHQAPSYTPSSTTNVRTGASVTPKDYESFGGVTGVKVIKPATPVKPAEPEDIFDASLIQINKLVNHKAYGDGIIISVDRENHYVVINFNNEYGEKTFRYPLAFTKGFLSFKENK